MIYVMELFYDKLVTKVTPDKIVCLFHGHNAFLIECLKVYSRDPHLSYITQFRDKYADPWEIRMGFTSVAEMR